MFMTVTFCAFCVEESSTEANRPPVLLHHACKFPVMRTSCFYPSSKSHACPVDVLQGDAGCLVPSSPCHAEVQGRLIRALAYALEHKVLSNESTDGFLTPPTPQNREGSVDRQAACSESRHGSCRSWSAGLRCVYCVA